MGGLLATAGVQADVIWTKNASLLAKTRVGVDGNNYPFSITDTDTLIAGGAVVTAQAFWRGDVSGVWNANSAGNTNWATTAAGTTDLATLPGPFTDVIFSARDPGNLTTTLGANTAVNSVTFAKGSGAVIIGGANELTLNATGAGSVGFSVASGTTLQTVTAPVRLAADQTWMNNGTFGVTTLTLDGTISSTSGSKLLKIDGSGDTQLNGILGASINGVEKNGVGTLTLGASNSFAGPVTVNAGLVTITADENLGAAANDVMLNGGGTLHLSSSFTLGSGRSLVVNGTQASPSGLSLHSDTIATLAHTAALIGTGTLKLSQTGADPCILSVEEAQDFSGALVVGTPGKLVGDIFSISDLPAERGLFVRLQSAGKLANVSSVEISNGSTILISQRATAVTGRLLASLAFRNGRFQYDPSFPGGPAVSDTFGGVTATGLLTLIGGATPGPHLGTTLNFGTFIRTDNATLALQSDNLYNQGGTIGGGANTGVNYKFNGMTNSGGTPDTIFRGVVPWAAATDSNTSSSLTHLVTYDENGFRKLTTNEFRTVTSQSQFDGPSTNSANIALNTASELIINSTKTINSLTVPSFDRPTISGGGTLVITSGAVVNALTFNGPTLNFPAGGYFHLGFLMTVSGASRITGTGGVTTSAVGTSRDYRLRLEHSSTSTFTGGLFINGNSQVSFTDNTQLGQESGLNAGSITLGGGQLGFRPNSAATVSLSDGTASRAIKINASNGTIGTEIANAVLQIPGVISGEGQLRFGGSRISSALGVVELTNPAANTYSGGTLISFGILRLSNSNQLGTGPVLLERGTIQAAANLTFTTTPTLVSYAAIDTQDNTVTLSGGLGGSAGIDGTRAITLILTKNGTGTLDIAGESTFAGAINVASGRVLLRGTLSGVSALTASTSRMEFGISDGINDTVAVTLTGATLATMGFSETVGTLTLGSGVSTIDLGGGASLLYFAASNAQPWTGSLSIANWSGLTSGGGTDQLYFGFDASSLAAGQIAAISFLNPAGFTPGTYPAALLATGELVAVIPESGSASLLLFGAGMLGMRRRRG